MGLVERAVRLPHLDLVPEVERDARDVEARAEVRARGRCADAEAHAAAACGSFRPWPVTTQTTRSPERADFGSPAIPAAEAGSQNNPSSWPSRRHASRISSSD